VKKLSFLFLILLFSTSGMAASPPAPVAFPEVAAKTSVAFCAKMEECATQKIPQEKCVREMQSTFQLSYEALPKTKKVEVQSSDLELCTKSIKSSTCEQLKTAHQLKGCDFIQKLGS